MDGDLTDEFANLSSSNVVPQEGKRVKVTDLDTAIYMYMRSLEDSALGIKLDDAYKVGPARHHVIFLDEYGMSRRIEVEFRSDRCMKFAMAQRSLKGVIRRMVPNERSSKRRS